VVAHVKRIHVDYIVRRVDQMKDSQITIGRPNKAIKGTIREKIDIISSKYGL